jgi:hypothetical protein
VGKSRLHNRYLHGTGVVCGLEVLCDPCNDAVTVRPGYALGPCGEDIVVCADTRVDVGAIIQAGRRAKARTADCSPYAAVPDRDCDEALQRWTLGICYDEQPVRPVTSLTTGSCEPTATREGFRWTLTKVKPAGRGKEDPGAPRGELAARVKRCLDELVDGLSDVPADPSTDELVEYCCVLKGELRELLQTASVYNCLLGRRLSDVVCPSAQDRQAGEKATQAIQELLAIAADLYRQCLCSALLPPCPDTGGDCVPLATLVVRAADLKVLEVCNFSVRTFAVTMPTLGYWTGWLPFAATLRQLVTRLCCPPARPPREFRLDSGLESILSQGLGATSPDGNALADDAEPSASVLARLAGPAGAELGRSLRGLLGQPEVDADRFAKLEATVAKLQRTVNAQARTISTLRKRGEGT